MKTGITGYGAYIPRLRMSRSAIYEANAWFAPDLKGKSRGERSLANWDEDSITMAVAAARDALAGEDREASKTHIQALSLASTTLPYAERLNAGVVAQALDLDASGAASDLTGSQTCALSALSQALLLADASQKSVLLTAADSRRTRAASAPEMDYGDGAAAMLIGSENIIAEVLGQATITVDFIDRFRATDRDIDYHWEERWVRDEGIGNWVPKAIQEALADSAVQPGDVDHFIFPSSFRKIQAQLAKSCGLPAESPVDPFTAEVGDTGAAHGLLMLASVLESATPGQTIVLAQFGSGASAFVFRVTDAIKQFKPGRGVSGWLARGRTEASYTRFLAYKGQLEMEGGRRGEADKLTSLSVAYRNRRAFLALVAGRDKDSGEVHFPPSRISYTPDAPRLDNQLPHPLAERQGSVLSWSAESLSTYMSPPHHYGQIDFDGGGRILMEFTDVIPGEVDTGLKVEMTFRIKNIDDMRGFKAYFWKATPVSVEPDSE